MPLSEILELTVSAARATKEKACRNKPKDILHIIDAYRGNDLIASIHLGEPGHRLVQVYRMAAAGFEADILAFVMESFTTGPNMPEPDRHPLTGEPLVRGDLTELAEHGGIEQGYVRECLWVAVANRAGDELAAKLAYHYAAGKYLVWDDPWYSPEGGVGVGGMADPMHAAMAKDVTFGQVFPGLTSTEADRAELDVAVAAVIGRHFRCNIMVGAQAEGERAGALRRAARQRGA